MKKLMYDFTVPSAMGHLTSLFVPAMRLLPVYLKNAGQPGFGGGEGWVLLE